jgi:acetyl esterase/lipase
MTGFHPELERLARRIPRISFTPTLARLANWVQRLRGTPPPPQAEGVAIRDLTVPGPDGNAALRIRLYSPSGSADNRPAMLWIHGGGFIIGTPEQDEAGNIALCRELGLVIAAVDYRLAPQHPYPAPMDDCHAALQWLHDQAAVLGVDRSRIAIGGNSAGAGLAAGLVLRAHDEGQIRVAFQLLIYPMLDDRTALRTDIDERWLRMWSVKSNRFGWGAYLGQAPGSDAVPAYAAPARRANLDGLPPAWIGVGTCDLFHDEDIAYARRLNEAGVPCALHIVEGGFHGFDLAGPKASVVRAFRESYVNALRTALHPQ